MIYAQHHLPKTGDYLYPPRYAEVVDYLKKQEMINHTVLQCKYNLRYAESRAIIHALQYDELISINYDLVLKGYRVVKQDET